MGIATEAETYGTPKSCSVLLIVLVGEIWNCRVLGGVEE